MIESTAAVVDGTVYLGASNGMLYAIDSQNGKSTWKYEATDSIKSSPSVKDGVIYFGDSGGIFHAVDTTTRKRNGNIPLKGRSYHQQISLVAACYSVRMMGFSTA